MTSKQKRRTPHNIYTEKRAEREFQDFIQHSKSTNVPIPDRLLATSKPPQATDENAPAAPKRQKLTPPEVHQHFLFSIWSFLILSQNSDKDQGASSPRVNEIKNPIPPGSASDHDPEGGYIPDHHPSGSQESGPGTASNLGSFQPAALDLEEGEPDTGIYIPALQVTMTNIQTLKNATLEESGMAPEDIDRLRDPESAHGALDLLDTHLVKALRHFIYLSDTSRNHYETI